MEYELSLSTIQMRNFLSLSKTQQSGKLLLMSNPKLNKVKDYCAFIEPLLSTGISPLGNKYVKLGDSDGDSMLWLGLLNSVLFPADNKWALKSILECQDIDGQFFRSPRKRHAHDYGFSRDMSLGLMLGIIDSEFPQELAQKWIDFIDRSRACVVKKPKWAGGGCALRSPVYKFCPSDDDRANITPTTWAIMNRVFSFRGLKRNDQMKLFDKADGDISLIEAEEAPLGYQLHLKAVQSYIKYLIGQSREYSIKVGEICHKRQPENLFYEFLAKRYFSVEMIDRYLALAEIVDGTHLSNEWMWEKSTINPQESSGWCMLFMGKLILWHSLASAESY
jgi:hypothetical protein